MSTRLRRTIAALASAAMLAAGLTALGGGVASATTTYAWGSMGSGVDDTATASVTIGGKLYVAGDFTVAGGLDAAGVAVWDGTTWSSLGASAPFRVDVLATDGTNLYAGGSYVYFAGALQSPGGVAMWDGTDWIDLEAPPATSVTSLVWYADQLWMAGDQYRNPTTPADRDCRLESFDGTPQNPSWVTESLPTATDPRQPAPNGLGDCLMGALTVVGSQLIVTGGFDHVSAGLDVAMVVAYDRGIDEWTALGDGLDLGGGLDGVSVYAASPGLTAGTIVLGGDFYDADGRHAGMAAWDGTGWNPVHGLEDDGQGGDGVAMAFAAEGGSLIVGGIFTTADGVTAHSVARWDGQSFTPIGTGFQYADGTLGEVYTIANYKGTVIAGGAFDKAGLAATLDIAQWKALAPPATTTAPSAPRLVRAAAGATTARVVWAPSASNGGSRITRYTVTASPGGRTCSVTMPTPEFECTITGLARGTWYRFSVRATTAVGTSLASLFSNSVRTTSPHTIAMMVHARALFLPGGTQLGPKARAALAALIAQIPRNARGIRVSVIGYVQGAHPSANDQALSLARAKVTTAWLKAQGLAGAYSVRGGGIGSSAGFARSAIAIVRYTLTVG
jgi:outer membrane protein OmpA-like peptidoglycan-associated protein